MSASLSQNVLVSKDCQWGIGKVWLLTWLLTTSGSFPICACSTNIDFRLEWHWCEALGPFLLLCPGGYLKFCRMIPVHLDLILFGSPTSLISAGHESLGHHGDGGELGYSNMGTVMTIYEERKGIWVFNGWFILLRTSFIMVFINFGNQFYDVENQSKLKRRNKTLKNIKAHHEPKKNMSVVWIWPMDCWFAIADLVLYLLYMRWL